MRISANRAFMLFEPGKAGARIPVVIDSPHSGSEYPDGHGIIAPPDALRTCCDAWVDELWRAAPAYGAPLLAARFPRAFIDPNRAPDDIDPGMLAQPWPHALAPSAACRRGMGLIRRDALPGVPMYRSPLPAHIVSERISQFYMPYHHELARVLESVRGRFGHVWHINCHSMKSVGNAMNADAGMARPDIVVSDCLGRSANPAFTEWVADAFVSLGYRVRVNDPYQGGYIVEHYGRPIAGCHSVQVEIRRDLYMNEQHGGKSERFDTMRADITAFLQLLVRYIKSEAGAR